jgi:hypothetical protein
MLKKTLIAVALLTAVFFSASSYAAEKSEGRPKEIDVTAEIVSVDLAVPEVIIKQQVSSGNASAFRYVTLRVVPETDITKGDEVLSVADLKAGDKATVGYLTDDAGISTATSIYLEGDSGPGPDILIEDEPGDVMTLGNK